MSSEEAIMYLTRLKDRINFEVTDAQGKMDALNLAIKALQEQEDRNEFYNWDAPIRHKADGEYISRKALLEDLYKRDYTKFTHRDFVALVQYQDIVAIPPEHDGCKDCRWQSQSETEMPCKQCMHNYTDEWEVKRPDKIDIVKLCASEVHKQLEQYNISGDKYHLGFANACAWIRDKYREG